MIHDSRSPFQRAEDSHRCPTCGHRPQDAMDELQRQEMGGGGTIQRRCPSCNGTGFGQVGYPFPSPCGQCRGRGHVAVRSAP